MLKLSIDKPGEHKITIKIKAIGDNDLNDYYMVEFADSPESLWSSAGERKLSININDKKYEYGITDEPFRFELKKEKK